MGDILTEVRVTGWKKIRGVRTVSQVWICKVRIGGFWDPNRIYCMLSLVGSDKQMCTYSKTILTVKFLLTWWHTDRPKGYHREFSILITGITQLFCWFTNPIVYKHIVVYVILDPFEWEFCIIVLKWIQIFWSKSK